MKKLEVIQNKIVDNEDNLKRLIAYWRFHGKKIVFTNGCFDLIHRGHIDYLAKAADMGNVLIIGLNTDDSVRRIKGKQRPVQDEQSRALILASLHFVNAVLLFDEDTPYNLIQKIQPDVLVKGSDYQPEKIVGYDIVTKNGGEISTIDFLEGYSTSAIIQKLQSK
jgi:rfaE bifunctional protein nucleotidyltransferase chain/domain